MRRFTPSFLLAGLAWLSAFPATRGPVERMYEAVASGPVQVARSARKATSRLPGKPVLPTRSEIANQYRQQARKLAAQDGTGVRVLRWRFRAVAGMKARKIGVPLFDREA